MLALAGHSGTTRSRVSTATGRRDAMLARSLLTIVSWSLAIIGSYGCVADSSSSAAWGGGEDDRVVGRM